MSVELNYQGDFMEQVIYNAARVIKNYRNKKSQAQQVRQWIVNEIEAPTAELPVGMSAAEKQEKLQESLVQCDLLLSTLDETMNKLKNDLKALNQSYVLELAEIIADTMY